MLTFKSVFFFLSKREIFTGSYRVGRVQYGKNMEKKVYTREQNINIANSLSTSLWEQQTKHDVMFAFTLWEYIYTYIYI